MNKVLVTIYCAISLLSNKAIAQVPLPQLQAGIYVNDSIQTLDYYFFGSCGNINDVEVYLNTNLIPVATGIELKYIVTQLTTAPDSVYSIQKGILHLYDTLTFSLNNPIYRFYSSVPGLMQLKLMLVGTPSVPFENYSCEFINLITLANCANHAGIIGLTNQCSVDNFTKINESQFIKLITVKPNPACNYFEINSFSNLNKELEFCLFNLQGQLKYKGPIISKFNSKIVNVEELSNGLYIWKLIDQFETKQTGKIIIAK